jgi:hypothetical protein
MDIVKMLSDLRSERQRLQEAILAIERLAAGGAKRRGRPPKWMSNLASMETSLVEPAPKRTVSLAARKRMAAAQKRRWAALRKAQTA